VYNHADLTNTIARESVGFGMGERRRVEALAHGDGLKLRVTYRNGSSGIYCAANGSTARVSDIVNSGAGSLTVEGIVEVCGQVVSTVVALAA
jgi:hypothetical protein